MSEMINLPFRDGDDLEVDRARAEHLRRVLRWQLEGYVYVIEFSSGTVKVGKTTKIGPRLSQHAKDARNHGITITKSWQSAAHRIWSDNERKLIEFCWTHFGHPVSGDEYFTGADFDAIVQFAGELAFPALADHDLDRAVAEQIHAEQTQRAARLAEEQRRNRIADGLPADLPDPALTRAAREWFDSLSDEDAEEVGAAIRHRLAREEWLERKVERKRMREIEAQLALTA